MANFKFKVAYTTDANKVEPSLASGVIDSGDLVIVNENNQGTLKFITNENVILPISATVDEAVLQAEVRKAVEEIITWVE